MRLKKWTAAALTAMTIFAWKGDGMAKTNFRSASAMARALWVECEGTNETLSSRQKIDQLVQIAAENRFNLIFVQLYRGNSVWWNTGFIDCAPARDFAQREKTDMLQYLIEKAHRRGIEVHGWVNMLRVVRNPNQNYPVLKMLGTDVITRNGKGLSIWTMPAGELPDGGYWLDAGDPRVKKFLGDLAADLVRRTPQLDGVHLDFIRVPYEGISAGSMWDGGRGFGCGKKSVERFKQATGLDPFRMEKTRDNCQRWDDWRRDQVTDVVRTVKRQIEQVKPSVKLTAAVQCWPDRAYLTGFQDWGRWLDEGIVDAVVTMNYGTDTKLVRQLSQQALAMKGDRQVYIGLGAYLLDKDLPKFRRQMENTLALHPDGIALFSYDSMLLKPKMFDDLRQNFFTAPADVPEMAWKSKSSLLAAEESNR